MGGTMLVDVLKVIVWPCVALCIVAIFAGRLKEMLSHVNSARFKGIEATFGYGEAAVDRGTASLPGVATPAEAAGAIEPPVAGHIEQVDWSKNGDLFWLGYDLLWTVDTLLRGGPALDITWGLNQALHHARSIGFQDAAITGSLSGLREAALDNCDDDWTARRRNDVASRLSEIATRVGDLASASQRGWVPYAAGASPVTRTVSK